MYIIFVVKMAKHNITLSSPTPGLVDYYLHEWEKLKNYTLQEKALNKLFFYLCPQNNDIESILLKVAALNDFYSTNIFSVFPVAEHIRSIIDIDKRLSEGDISLVVDIQRITISNVEKNFYSFATKYCSHHQPDKFPIYDSYVDQVLRAYRKLDNFSLFKNEDLKNYDKFCCILKEFRVNYNLESFSLKQIDRFLWLIGKDNFPKSYKKN